MAIRSESSRPTRSNVDGTVAVFCSECKGFIGNSVVRMRHATCAVCALALEGIRTSEEKLAEYNASKGGRRGDVSFLRVPQPGEDNDEQPFSLRSLGSGVAKAFGFPKIKTAELESVKTSKKKRRKPLFETADQPVDAAGIGSMAEIDEALKPK